MNRHGIGVALLLIVVAALGMASPASAEASLQVQPLQYVETLKKAERKKGFIDITNPQPVEVTVALHVQGFRQADNQGNLSFYEDQQLREAIQLDYASIRIPAQRTLRLYFVVDGAKLPVGDVFAVIFAKIINNQSIGTEPSVQVGTLLLLTNQTPGARQAQVTELRAPLLQVGSTLRGQVTLRNTAPAATSSGFFPEITVQLWPLPTAATVTGPLLYAGNSRTVAFDEPSSAIGIYRLTARYGNSSQSKWVVVVTGIWRVIGGAVVIAVIVGMGGWRWYVKKRRNRPRRRLRL